MTEIGIVEDTLFVPLIGRIHASEHFPWILRDEKALELRKSLPARIFREDRQGEYTLVASASRSAGMDRYVREFLELHPDGAVVELGCGLETTFHRNDNGRTRWFAVDLPAVIAYRRTLLPATERQTLIAGDAFDEGWIRAVRASLPDAPLLILASGLFYYFKEEEVLGLFHMLRGFGRIEIVLDAVSRIGLAMMRRKLMKDVRHADAEVYFHVDSARELAGRSGGTVEVIAEEPFYRSISRRGLRLPTRLCMNISDRLRMVKMVHLRIRNCA
ncbi:class I SAM-dependent methyltransferase [Sutterella sp.]|uniref:class I SAM-dependent methyltransferase n=1 Tax=Sutterella sp. TaxID=1981025 RepID=UPI0026DF80F9|nr:class I SAM-dependent methyltransferase [Sutterella sp.]MDO5532238.1 class I SAM-dependent methyltransferase [Sutterella sp.]